MSDRCTRSDPFQTVLFEGKFPEKRRKYAHRVCCRADIVAKTGQGQLTGIGAPTDAGSALENQYRGSIARQCHRCGESIGTRSNNYRIELLVRLVHSFKVWHKETKLSLRRPCAASKGPS